MPARRKSFLGALALAVFITTCLAWLFQGAGTSVAAWGYVALLAFSALLILALAGLVRKNGGQGGHVRSIDSYEELE